MEIRRLPGAIELGDTGVYPQMMPIDGLNLRHLQITPAPKAILSVSKQLSFRVVALGELESQCEHKHNQDQHDQ